MNIEIEKQNETEEDFVFVVVLNTPDGKLPFVVALKKQDHKRLAPEKTPEQLVEGSFRFLLDREPVSAIMKEFDISVISQYFPEYEQEISQYITD